MYSYAPAEVAELVDAPASGAGELMLVEVQVLFSAPLSFCAQERLAVVKRPVFEQRLPPRKQLPLMTAS